MLQSAASLNPKTPSPKPSISSSRQKLAQTDVPIETLISWLVAAKRSLSSIHHVHRATTILVDSRTTIETTTALIARTKYLRRSLNSQLKILRSVQYELEASAHNVKQDIHATIRQLDRSDKELHKNVSLLRDTRVEDGFRSQTGMDQDAEEKNTLHDFVDDKPVHEIAASMNTAKGSVQQAQSTMDQSIRTLEDDLQAINEVLADRTATSSATKSDLQIANIPRQLHSLEANAREMAQSLEMLVSHFDLCVTAIKNTEGGGAAVAQNVGPDDLPEGVDVHAFEAPAQSMTMDERAEMLKVLRNDAAEVDEVVAELQDRGSEMETILERIYTWRETSEHSYRDVSHAFHRLEQVAQRLPTHLAEANDFAAHWTHEKANLEDIIVGIDQLCDVYDNFLTAYDGMIVEAARRRSVRKRMEKIVQDAQAQLDQLYDDDLNEREIFRSEQGDFLPSDIWYGLSSTPAKFAFQKMSDDGFDSVPDLPKEIVASALRRLKAAQGLQES